MEGSKDIVRGLEDGKAMSISGRRVIHTPGGESQSEHCGVTTKLTLVGLSENTLRVPFDVDTNSLVPRRLNLSDFHNTS